MCSFPNSNVSIVSRRVHRRIVMIDVKRSDSVLVTFELWSNFSFLDVNNFDFCIGAPNSNSFGRFVKGEAMSNGITSINGSKFLHHSNIPQLDDTIWIAWRHITAINWELDVVNCVQVAVKCLDSEPSSHVPNTCAPVSWSCNKKVSERLEV